MWEQRSSDEASKEGRGRGRVSGERGCEGRRREREGERERGREGEREVQRQCALRDVNRNYVLLWKVRVQRSEDEAKKEVRPSRIRRLTVRLCSSAAAAT